MLEYQRQAKLTACKQADLAYCLLGLANEAGELAGVVKKWRRGDYGEDELRKRLLGELGDVLWYVVMVLDRMGAAPNLPSVLWVKASRLRKETLTPREMSDRLLELTATLLRKASLMLVSYCEGGNLCLDISMFDTLAEIGRLFDLNLADIAAHNLAKLADRQQRGVIRGDGDER